MMALATALLLAGAGTMSVAAPPAPHMFVIVIDDLGWDDVNGYAGNAPEPRTPNLAQLKRDGVEMEMRTFKFCSPTRSAILTGRYPYHIGQQTEMNMNPACTIECGVNLEYDFLPKALKKSTVANYTSLFIGKYHQGYFQTNYTPTGRGFDHGLGFYAGGEYHVSHVSPYEGGVPLWWTPWNNATYPRKNVLTDLFNSSAGGPAEPLGPEGLNGTLNAYIYGNETIRFIEHFDATRAPNDRMFAYVALHDVHVPYEAPLDLYNDYEGVVTNNIRRVLLSMSSAMDRTIGQIRQAIEASSLAEDGFVIQVLSDNGGNLRGCGNDGVATSNWPRRGGKFTDWTGGTVVGSIVYSPKLLPASVRGETWDGLVHAVDIYATLAALAGAPTNNTGPVGVDGVDYWNQLLGGQPSERNETVINIYTQPTSTDGSRIVPDPAVSAARAGLGARASANTGRASQSTKLYASLEWIQPGRRWRFYQGYPGSPDAWSPPYNATRMAALPGHPAAVVHRARTADPGQHTPDDVKVIFNASAPGTVQLPCPLKAGAAELSLTEEELGALGLLPNPPHAPAPSPTLCVDTPCLFDLLSDPWEEVDVAGQFPDVVSHLQARAVQLARTEVSLAESGLCPAPPPSTKWPKAYDSNWKSGYWQPWCDHV